LHRLRTRKCAATCVTPRSPTVALLPKTIYTRTSSRMGLVCRHVRHDTSAAV
jgi:hypothetical protein